MEIGCPVCNGLLSIGEVCNKCSGVMEDMGRIEDFYNPYSPYEEQDGIPLLQNLLEIVFIYLVVSIVRKTSKWLFLWKECDYLNNCLSRT